MIDECLKQSFLSLVRLGIGTEPSTERRFLADLDWERMKALADAQGLSAVALDGLDKVPSSAYDMPAMMKKQWIGEVLQGYEYRYEQYRRAIVEMAGFYNSHGFKMMVLKGYACSLDWPKPEHRPTGDIDIWQFGQYREADAALATEKKIDIDRSHHHHTVFYWRDFMVENHYDFINIHHHKSHVKLEKILKKLCEDDTYSTEVYGEHVYLPSPDLHALFLLKHLALHFASGEMLYRQILDWAFFIKKHGDKVDWNHLLPVLKEFHLQEFFAIVNAICVDDLGFDSALFPSARFDDALKSRVSNEILSPEFAAEMPSSLIPRLVFKYHRWRANEWKHKLCFKESMWSAFWSGVGNHLLKPLSI